MVQSLQLGTPSNLGESTSMRRVNRVPIALGATAILIFFAVVVLGLSWRGSAFNGEGGIEGGSEAPASSFGDQLKRGISDGIIGDPTERETFQPAPPDAVPEQSQRSGVEAPDTRPQLPQSQKPATDTEWREKLLREQEEQTLRERNRQRMARLQAQAAALDSPLTVDTSKTSSSIAETKQYQGRGSTNGLAAGNAELYSEAIRKGMMGSNADPNTQLAKEEFFNQDIRDLGYLPRKVVNPLSRHELKRGSVIPATLITGINSDLPGRIIAQVSQNVYDSATGYRQLIPQGAKLFGRYDSKISFGQKRVLVVWTDLVFPDGATLQIGGMAGTDAEGYGGFSDKVDRHLLRTFGSAALVAIIGTGIDMSLPESSTLATQDTATDAARRNFAETFGRAAEQTISKNLNVQPTIRIRPGYKFNVLVDQDIIFPAATGAASR